MRIEGAEAVACHSLLAEFKSYRATMTKPERTFLFEQGIPIGTILFLVGTARIRRDRSKQYFEPAEDGLPAFITPVMVEWADTPEAANPAQAVRFGELVDLVAWHPARPESWALRIGAAEWLGAIEPQYMDPAPVRVHRTVLSWLQDNAQGIVPLCRAPEEMRNVLTYCASIAAEDKAHAIDLRRALRAPWHAPAVFVGVPRGP